MSATHNETPPSPQTGSANPLADIFPITTTRDPHGGLQIAGLSLTALAETYGTPLYLYDGATVRAQADALKTLLSEQYPADYEITYAAKAYFAPAFARRLAAMGLGVDVVSRGEMITARNAGFAPEKVHLHGNNKSREELEMALDWQIQAIVVDSLEELTFLQSLAEARQMRARIWLRITPGLHVDTHPYRQTAHPTSKFGLLISDGQALAGIRQARSSRWSELVGLHAHLGSQLFETDTYFEAINMLAALAEQADFVPQEFSPGGGWGVRYTPQDPQPDPRDWVKNVSSGVLSAFQQRGWLLPRLIVEPGRFIAARAGVALYRVGTSKTVADGTCVVAVDGGMADNPRPALYRSRYSATLANRRDPGPTYKTNIVGKFCETGDLLISGAELPAMQRGDLLAMPAAGAYQLSMASNYNLAPRPAALWLENGHASLLQPREEPDETHWWGSPA